MPKESQPLWLDALNCNWNGTRTRAIATLTCTWFFADDEIITLIGALSLINFARFSGDAVADFWIREGTIGEHQRMFQPCEKVSLATLQNISPNAPLNIGEDYQIYGIPGTGLFWGEDLEGFTKQCRTVGSNWELIWTSSSEAGRLVGATSVRLSSLPLPWGNGE